MAVGSGVAVAVGGTSVQVGIGVAEGVSVAVGAEGGSSLLQASMRAERAIRGREVKRRT